MSDSNGGPAFPTEYETHGWVGTGMSLRDYFAAKAMAAMISTAAVPCMTGLATAALMQR